MLDHGSDGEDGKGEQGILATKPNGVKMSIPKDLMRENPDLSVWAIMTGYRGSIAHGMYIPNKEANSIDDKDVMSICVPPIDYYLGLKQYGSRGTREIKRDEWDIVIYELKKFIFLLEQGNPNVLMMLWLDAKNFLFLDDAGKLLLANRDLFVGRHVYRAFTGYAISQLHRMTHSKFEGYMGSKRKSLVEKYGYDCKNAAHLIRLLRMGIEFLKEGRLYVERQDAKQLLEIKNGEWPLERVKEESDRYFKLHEEAWLNSNLPEGPNHEAINKLCIDILRRCIVI
jgi:uncharacterized protein